ncbi:MAG: winged helix-turn-helix domain-containing protein, partial [Gammaproteobacteria bacterium]|nr:winged helix-turn-helix domain-containing protein [Gammaproteobacteria bacterium]
MSVDLLHGFCLGPWNIEPLRGAITGPRGETRHVEPMVMDVFVCLAEHANDLVTRDELQETVWKGRAVTDEPLTRAIGELRRALEDGGETSQYIETVPKRGY